MIAGVLFCACTLSFSSPLRAEELPPVTETPQSAPATELELNEADLKSPGVALWAGIAGAVGFVLVGQIAGSLALEGNQNQQDTDNPNQSVADEGDQALMVAVLGAMSLGTVLGPSFGQMYAGHHGRAWLHSGFRMVALFGLVGVVGWTVENADGAGSIVPVALGALAVGGVYATMTIWAILDGRKLVRIDNARKKRGLATSSWSLTPTVLMATPTPQKRKWVPGLALSASF